MGRCSYDVHVQEIAGSLIIGSSVVMLSPDGNMDLKYVLKILNEKEVTYLQSVPSYTHSLINFLRNEDSPKLNKLRTLDLGGE